MMAGVGWGVSIATMMAKTTGTSDEWYPTCVFGHGYATGAVILGVGGQPILLFISPVEKYFSSTIQMVVLRSLVEAVDCPVEFICRSVTGAAYLGVDDWHVQRGAPVEKYFSSTIQMVVFEKSG